MYVPFYCNKSTLNNFQETEYLLQMLKELFFKIVFLFLFLNWFILHRFLSNSNEAFDSKAVILLSKTVLCILSLLLNIG